MTRDYRSLFVGELVQQSFSSVGGTDDLAAPVDSPFCRDGLGQPTLRGSGLAGALIATLRRILNGQDVPGSISGSDHGRQPSVWRFFNSHQPPNRKPAYRQHVAIDARTGAAADSALFNLETMPPGTSWAFLLEVDTARDSAAAAHARAALQHWLAGRCLIGREVARGLGWMRLATLNEYKLTTEHIDDWPCAYEADNYSDYIAQKFAPLAEKVTAADKPLPGWIEFGGSLAAGVRSDEFGAGYGIDSVSVGGHASDDLAAAWDQQRFLAPDGMTAEQANDCFDPDASVVMLERGEQRLPYIPGSSLRGPLRHALARLLRARGQSTDVVRSLFGTVEQGAKLLICDAMPDAEADLTMAWFQHHAEDEFAGGVYGSGKFDRIAVVQGRFTWRMVLERGSEEEKSALKELFSLACSGQIGIGGGQWRGHGWLHWELSGIEKLEFPGAR